MTRTRLALWSLALALGAWSVVAAIDSATRAVPYPPLVDGEFCGVDSTAPPAGGDWRPATLPDDWEDRELSAVGGWYRFRFEAGRGAAEPLAVYLPAVHMNAAVWVNGRFAGDGGSFEEPVARNWNRPLFFPLPSDFARPGANVLDVRVKADHPGGGFLGPLYVGPRTLLEPAYARRYFFRATVLRGFAVSQAVLILFLGALWLQRRRETLYGWFAAASLAWTLTWPNLLVADMPIPTRAWMLVWYLAGVWFILLLGCFVFEFIGERSPRADRAFLVYGAAGSALLCVLAASGSSWFDTVATRGWITLGFGAGGYAIWRLLAAFRRDPASFELRVGWVAGMVVFACGINDWLILAGIRGRDATFYAPYAAPLLQGAIGWVLLTRMVSALRRSEALAADLDRRIEETRRDIGRSQAVAREGDEKRVLADERERIMRDMHDGLGAHIVTTLKLLERNDVPASAVREAVRATLDDLRLTMESLAPADGDLTSTLAQLRSRLQPRLEAAGLAIEWIPGDMPPLEGFGPRRILHVLRIVEEAVANVVKHAGARRLAIRTALAESAGGSPAVMIEIADDGRGIATRPSHGRGMDNMRYRARSVGADLEVRSSADGTSVALTIPVRRQVEEALDPTRRG